MKAKYELRRHSRTFLKPQCDSYVFSEGGYPEVSADTQVAGSIRQPSTVGLSMPILLPQFTDMARVRAYLWLPGSGFSVSPALPTWLPAL